MLGTTSPLDVIFYLLIFASFFLLPRWWMMYSIINLLETKAKSYDEMVAKSQALLLKKIDKKTKLSKKELQMSIKRMMEYFVVDPDTVETTGLAKKVRELTYRHDKKLDIFVEEIASEMDPIDKKNVAAGLMHTIGIYQITKIIRHYIGMIRETKNFAIGMQLQMILPFIDKQVKALYASIPAFTGRIPVGDCIGPLYAATLTGNAKTEIIAEGTALSKKKIDGREVFILKAEGPAANLGQIDEAIRKITAKNKIEKVITIDASGKLEGEKTGAVAEGVGFAMGPRGAERFFAETHLIDKKIPIDSIVIKMKNEEALMPMPIEIKKAIPQIDEAVRRSLREVKGKVIIAGIGVTIGVGNNSAAAKEAEKVVEKYHRHLEAKKRQMEKNKGFLNKVLGR